MTVGSGCQSPVASTCMASFQFADHRSVRQSGGGAGGSGGEGVGEGGDEGGDGGGGEGGGGDGGAGGDGGGGGSGEGGGEGGGGEGGEGGGGGPKQILKPDLVTEPSVAKLSDEAETPTGPAVPLYGVPPTVTLS